MWSVGESTTYFITGGGFCLGQGYFGSFGSQKDLEASKIILI